jgi:hypothetical protein
MNPPENDSYLGLEQGIQSSGAGDQELSLESVHVLRDFVGA